jgi:hypothetical protein
MDERGKIVLRKRLSRHDLMPFLAKLPAVRIGMEACGGAHDWARRFREHGHELKRMAPQFAAIPGGRPNPVTTATTRLAFRKHPYDNTPLTGTF